MVFSVVVVVAKMSSTVGGIERITVRRATTMRGEASLLPLRGNADVSLNFPIIKIPVNTPPGENETASEPYAAEVPIMR